MHISENLEVDIKQKYQGDLKELTITNIKRGRFYITIILLIEIVLFMANWYFSYKPIANSYCFPSSQYGFMYLLMILVSIIYLSLFNILNKRLLNQHEPYISAEILAVSYLTFIMSWSAVISLFDQRLYGNVSAYLVSLALGSMIFYLKSRRLIIPYLVSISIFLVGLPYFQASFSIIVGHLVNVLIFLILSWVMARTLYYNFIRDYSSRSEIDSQNDQLSHLNQKLLGEIALREKVQEELEKTNQELKRLSLVDELTGIANRRNLNNYLQTEWKRTIREGKSISLLMIDIDHFKALNDNYGHLYGDSCLIEVAQALRSCCRRPSDFVARLGGEEFLFVCSNADQEGTMILAENIKNTIQGLKIKHEYSPVAEHLTVSIGITITKPSTEKNIDDSINDADRALYNAKLAGRNKISTNIDSCIHPFATG